MTYADWREPVRRLRDATGPASEDLLAVAEKLGCAHANEPHGVLAAIVEDWLSPVLRGAQPLLVTEKQLAFLEVLGHVGGLPGMSRAVASAWIDHYLSLATADALERLQLSAGDTVRVIQNDADPEAGELADLGRVVTVSSIGGDGLVYFRGGNGQCAWPTRLRSDGTG
ncbi:hypothetical protein [Micrococcus luteus]|uniref:Uncharacterized protein n=1 Tax=Micrococcus luteus TaxID=1270 RepID=A0AAP3AGB4_MICLU|nr:hypothetical protein [Micrococcus luteus]MCJ2195323.1 hypothetical protein [Kaistella montana]MBU8743635.1 hypothetical protein [Micrococcus luteus]MCV7595416.1 hypothetical protein [Micrococcus luteus]MCV7620461.1 hypothetical protein [Micrococcus luteus]MCV7628639.1 hypothetical protein [Micrococcus luteus]